MKKVKKGFKGQLDAFDKVQVTKSDMAKSIEKRTPKEPTAAEIKEAAAISYKSGRKDMHELLKVFSIRFCAQVVFVMGFGRKSNESEKVMAAYCTGFNDRLDKERNK